MERQQTSEVRDGALGTRGHVRQTLERARQTLRTARERTATARALVARAESLVDGSSRAVRDSVALRAQLRASITAYVCHLRADGVSPEQMLILVKSTVREAPLSELTHWESRALMEDVVRWSVESYYHAA
jgi:tryptophanyl-tRNA synthetase